jgi:hypothetical protein
LFIHKEKAKNVGNPRPVDTFMRPQPVHSSVSRFNFDPRLGGTYDGGVESLGVLDVDGLNVGKETVLGTLLVVTLTADTDTESVRDTLDSLLPDLLVELGVETDVLGSLLLLVSRAQFPSSLESPKSSSPPISRSILVAIVPTLFLHR